MDYRTLGEEDAQALWRMMCALDRETSFMMYEPGEREETSSPLTVQARIRGAVARGDFLLAAEMDGEIVGYLWAERGALRRAAHSAYIVVGVLQRARGKGIGTQLFARMEAWTLEAGVTRLELTVECENEAALRLYRKCGFETEGLRKRSMLVNGAYVDEQYMAKLL
ncbi:MAG: GNAT family N-acetyltransferase [Clostridiales bacterium]|nr:GNAT family N-acetyltransferase [Clostridiales bacterium]MDO4350397.1 GNAT family N-acetyltransferase [Eubacteriales bacterium]MDY4008264.1 GNAT family N-acetyltransferase [Candidatus Limiplasma sp.]